MTTKESCYHKHKLALVSDKVALEAEFTGTPKPKLKIEN